MNSTNRNSAERSSDNSSPSVSLFDKPKFTRSEPWFDDGNVVLQVESSRFKVYRGILSKQSSTFRDLFEVGQPSTDERDEDGCSIVTLHGDSATEWQYALLALYESRSVCFTSLLVIKRNISDAHIPSGSSSYVALDDATSRIPFDVIAAFLRLGSKYFIERLRLDALNRLNCEYTSTFNQWEEIRLQKPILLRPHQGMSFDVINLARQNNILSILPAAFYDCLDPTRNLTWSLAQIFDGFAQPNGHVSILSPEDQKLCITGWWSLIRMQVEYTFGWIDPPADTQLARCRNTGCVDTRKSLRLSLLPAIPNCLALEPWDDSWAEGMCKFCADAAKRSHRQGRLKVWSALPAVFGLPNWDEISQA